MPNTFAYIALLSWPVVTLFLLRKYGIGPGSLISLLAAYMFLPASFSIDLPGLPDPDKFLMTTVTILLFIIFQGKKIGIAYLDKRFIALFLVFLVAPFITALTNQDRYLHLPGLSLYDGLSASITSFLEFIPFFIGLVYFRDEKEHFRMFKYFAIAAFIYSFFVLFEIRMSPQLHNWVYGYFPHSWIQQYRSGGFRAVVFMGHGLLVAMFLAMGIVFWASLKQAKFKVFRFSNTFGLTFVFITLMLSKSLAALIYGLFAVLAIKFLRSKQIYFASAVMALIFITYPISSATGLFPHGTVVDVASGINAERGGSLEYRFKHENTLLAHANQKPAFGWGAWGRNRIYDPETGEDISITDGGWVISLGTSGWVGFLSKFLFLFLPIWIVYRKNRYMHFGSNQAQILLAGNCLVLALIMVDQLPNASFNPLYWCLAGSLLGRTQVLLSKSISDR
ncbi:hypothetical protein [Methylophaga sp.]|uniref:hypothetical protein n=1 Tax=Methylophaga sp. TaxID=2024840 RepID=UPI003F721212